LGSHDFDKNNAVVLTAAHQQYIRLTYYHMTHIDKLLILATPAKNFSAV
jgi:hypothetical protein